MIKDPSEPKSLCPITLLPELEKVFECIKHGKITDNQAEEELHYANQYEFRKGQRTIQAVEKLIEIEGEETVRSSRGAFAIVLGQVSVAFGISDCRRSDKIEHSRCARSTVTGSPEHCEPGMRIISCSSAKEVSCLSCLLIYQCSACSFTNINEEVVVNHVKNAHPYECTESLNAYFNEAHRIIINASDCASPPTSTACSSPFTVVDEIGKENSTEIQYKTIIDHNAHTGEAPRKWQFFEAMRSFLHKKPEIVAPATCSSEKGLTVDKNAANESNEEDHFQGRDNALH
ncbi:hypothetical protein ILUMI_10609 [Ignelater luminosus]|uniref:Zinc finger protein 462-like seventh C2H2 zinc finger domain-containing protein n=1 Tax=Ignelater luminosus TaxID=2038154 RepID=A0A8K0CXK5_IGNLU|nr:hypothetical protein ILUMI_10609 [Ignelater luminosus]